MTSLLFLLYIPLILTSPLFAILKTLVVWFDATKISLVPLLLCCTIKAVELIFVLTTSKFSVVYI